MKALNEIYGKSFFSRRYKLNWRALPFCQSVKDVFSLSTGSTVIDVGCATGDFVKEYNRIGMIAFGIEGSDACLDFLECPKEYVYISDLRVKLPEVLTRFDFCQCLEVVEHIEEEYVDQLINNLCQLSNTILLSAAIPGQGGHHHVNCQPFDYWVTKFSHRGYERRHKMESDIKFRLAPFKNKPGIKAYYQNIIIFTKRGDQV